MREFDPSAEACHPGTASRFNAILRFIFLCRHRAGDNAREAIQCQTAVSALPFCRECKLHAKCADSLCKRGATLAQVKTK